MKNKMMFRIFGALASALIVVSVFIPFVSVTGYSQSLWQTYEAINTLYLPIMIIVFGVIGILAFAINIKTELAYTSTGALLFFLITQTIPVVEQNLLNTLSVGYYCLVIGTILTGIMAFICNLRTKQKLEETSNQQVPGSEQMSVIEQIDKLYDDQTQIVNDSKIENNNLIQPLPIEPIQQVEEVASTVVNDLPNNNTNINQNVDVIVNNGNEILNEASPIVEQPQMINEFNSTPEPVVANVPEEQVQVSNPVINEFEIPQSQVVNPVTAEFNSTSEPVVANVPEEQVQVSNPVINEFKMQQPQMINPVTAEFNSTSTTVVAPQPVQSIEPVQPIDTEVTPIVNEKKVDVMADPINNTDSNLDIFG